MAAMWILISVVSCSSTKERDPASPPAEEKVTEVRESLVERQIVSSVGFTPGQPSINRKAENEIKKAIEAANAKGDIVMVEVVMWPDQKFSKKRKPLSLKQRELNKERAKNLTALIDRGAPEAFVSVTDMSARSSPLSSFLDTRDDKMQKKLTSMGFTPGPNKSFGSGRPSTALLVIKVK